MVVIVNRKFECSIRYVEAGLAAAKFDLRERKVERGWVKGL